MPRRRKIVEVEPCVSPASTAKLSVTLPPGSARSRHSVVTVHSDSSEPSHHQLISPIQLTSPQSVTSETRISLTKRRNTAASSRRFITATWINDCVDGPALLLEFDGIRLTTDDLARLQPGEFLNDNLIEFYARYLRSRLSSSDRDRVHFFNTFFFNKLDDLGYDAVKLWTRPRGKLARTQAVNIFEKAYVVIPINLPQHWCLIILSHLNGLLQPKPHRCSPAPCMFLLDSMTGSGRAAVTIRDYVGQELRTIYGSAVADSVSIRTALPCRVVQITGQDNFSDCGVFVCHYLELFCQNPAALTCAEDFEESAIWNGDMDMARKREEMLLLIKHASESCNE